MNTRRMKDLACVAMALLCCASTPLLAQSLGAASSFAVEGFAGVTAAGAAGTVITGDVGSSPSASITGFPPALVAPPFGLHANDAAAIAAQAADVALFTTLGNGACTDNLGAQLNGANIGPGIHCFSSTADLAATGNLTLSGAGIYIFRVPTSLTANVGSTVALAGADPCSVFWQVGSAATLNGVSFPGNVVAQAGVTLGVGASLTGRALATAGPVTLSGGNTAGGCSAVSGAQPPTLTKAFNPASIVVGGTSTLTITLLNPNATAAALLAPLVDPLPAGVVVAAIPNASTTCAGAGAVVATAGSATVTLPATQAIPAGAGATAGACTVSVDVTGSAAGTFLDVIPVGALQTTNGNSTLAAQATLTITPAISPPNGPASGIPTLSEWAMILMALGLTATAFAAIRRRKG
jgi:ice-binding like protein/exosortase sorting signal-containing protein